MTVASALGPPAPVAAAATVAPATGGGSISADLAGTGNYVVLAGPSINEGAAGEFVAASTIVLTAPAGFAFQPATGSVVVGGTGCDLGRIGPDRRRNECHRHDHHRLDG